MLLISPNFDVKSIIFPNFDQGPFPKIAGKGPTRAWQTLIHGKECFTLFINNAL